MEKMSGKYANMTCDGPGQQLKGTRGCVGEEEGGSSR